MATRVDDKGKDIAPLRPRDSTPSRERLRPAVNADRNFPEVGDVVHARRVNDNVPMQLADFIMHGGIGIVRGGVDTGIAWANESFLTMSGYDRATIAARRLDWAAITPAEWHATDSERLVAALRTGYSPTYEKELLRADGSRWPVIVGYTIDAEADAAETITMFVVDLTASKTAEADRAATETRYARFLEVANVVFWTTDPQGRATLSSGSAARLGVATVVDDLKAQAALIHPEDREFTLRTWSDALASGNAYDIKVRARGLNDAAFRWTRLRAYTDRDAAGVLTGWYGTSEDIHERRLANLALEESEARFRLLADDMPVIVWLSDASGYGLYLSKRWYELTGQVEAEALGFGWVSAVIDEDQPRLASIRKLVAEGEAFELDFRVRRASGEACWVMCTGRPRHAADGSIMNYIGSFTDIHARKAAEGQLADTQLRLSRALDGTGVGVWEWFAETDSVVLTGSALGFTGIGSPDHAYRADDYRAAIHRDDRGQLLAAMDAYVAGRSAEFVVEMRIRTQAHGWVWVLDRGSATARDANGRATHMVGTLTNIDDAKRAEARLRWTVEHDAMTGLANRTLFHTRLEAALAKSRNCALALLDIDDFKAVNDANGHAAGDALLQVLAQRLRDFAYPHETVARLGGDEFTLIIPDCGDAQQVAARLELLRRQLDESFDHDGVILTCRSSIGVAIAPGDGSDASTLLKNADIAMYQTKHARRGAVTMFEPAFGARVRRDITHTATIRAALDAHRIAPCYHPVVRLIDGKVAGFEATAHVVGTSVDPIDVHDLDTALDEANLAVRLGRNLLDKVLADFAEWRAAGCGPEFISLNISLAELRRSDYAAHLLERLVTYGIPVSQLRVEVTEIGLNGGRGVGRSAATLAALSRGGIHVGLDNFGTGSASLAHLTRLTLAALKIDAQFIQRVADAGSEQTVVRAIIGLAQSFGLRSVALGVETGAQADKLAELGCTYGQGTFFGMPASAEATFAKLKG